MEIDGESILSTGRGRLTAGVLPGSIPGPGPDGVTQAPGHLEFKFPRPGRRSPAQAAKWQA
jgi:hypothetical protein